MLQCEKPTSDCSEISLTPTKQTINESNSKQIFFPYFKAIPLIQTIEQLLKKDWMGDAKYKKPKKYERK
jgi:hypothetical protein